MSSQIKELEEKINKNASKIEHNADKISKNTSALEILHSVKETALFSANRFFVMWLITFFALLVSIGYIIYLTNDINTITTQEVEQETGEGSNYFVGRDGDISG